VAKIKSVRQSPDYSMEAARRLFGCSTAASSAIKDNATPKDGDAFMDALPVHYSELFPRRLFDEETLDSAKLCVHREPPDRRNLHRDSGRRQAVGPRRRMPLDAGRQTYPSAVPDSSSSTLARRVVISHLTRSLWTRAKAQPHTPVLIGPRRNILDAASSFCPMQSRSATPSTSTTGRQSCWTFR